MSRRSIKTSGTSSPRIDSYSTASETSPPAMALETADVPQDPEFTKMLQEDKIKVMRIRTAALFNENVYLKTRFQQETSRAKELEERLAELESRIASRPESSNSSPVNESPDTQIKANECIKVTPSVCRLCYKKLQKTDVNDPIIFITKGELNNLEKDMEELRDGLATREKAWEGMMDREQTYCGQLTRFAQEIITVNQLAENRGSELETMATFLQEREDELKAARKEILGLKKLVAKLEKSARALEENSGGNTRTEMNERDRKWIESIVRQISSPRSRQKSKGSYYSTPRSNRNSARETTSTDT